MLTDSLLAWLFTPARRIFPGRRITVRLDGRDLTLTVAQVDARLNVAGLSSGRLKNIRVIARDIEWDGNRLDHASAVLRNVRLRSTAPPVLMAGPVELKLELPDLVLDDLFRWATPRLTGRIGSDGVARLHWARRPAIGNLEVDARVEGSTLLLRPAGLVLYGKRMGLPSRLPAYRVRLPDLPRGLQLTGVTFRPHLLCLSGTLPEWRLDLAGTRSAIDTTGTPVIR